jgi:antitoxin ParD1/3/4
MAEKMLQRRPALDHICGHKPMAPHLDNYYLELSSISARGIKTMPSSVDLGKQLESFVARLVESGRYNSRSEVLREGVRLVRKRETTLAALDAAIARGVADVEASRAKPIAKVFDRLERKYKAMVKAKRR